ncbi:MAG: DUF1294 domain-containing protein [Hyphomonadaceae bacterium JAD_PAG50586_4]|nr:MAG: DUF1294 domain-containing protein [Hyphomonadaceae bacterium JAD_PAG50586_4]
MTLMLAILGVNVIAFLAFGWDKRCAERRMRRIPENTLLGLALFGGAAGALVGQQLFRHKTRKQPFAALLWCAVAINVAALAIWLSPDMRVQFGF